MHFPAPWLLAVDEPEAADATQSPVVHSAAGNDDRDHHQMVLITACITVDAPRRPESAGSPNLPDAVTNAPGSAQSAAALQSVDGSIIAIAGGCFVVQPLVAIRFGPVAGTVALVTAACACAYAERLARGEYVGTTTRGPSLPDLVAATFGARAATATRASVAAAAIGASGMLLGYVKAHVLPPLCCAVGVPRTLLDASPQATAAAVALLWLLVMLPLCVLPLTVQCLRMSMVGAAAIASAVVCVSVLRHAADTATPGALSSCRPIALAPSVFVLVALPLAFAFIARAGAEQVAALWALVKDQHDATAGTHRTPARVVCAAAALAFGLLVSAPHPEGAAAAVSVLSSTLTALPALCVLRSPPDGTRMRGLAGAIALLIFGLVLAAAVVVSPCLCDTYKEPTHTLDEFTD